MCKTYVYIGWSDSFLYMESPARMRSISTYFSWFSLSIGFYLSLALVEVINLVTGKFTKSKTGWLDDAVTSCRRMY